MFMQRGAVFGKAAEDDALKRRRRRERRDRRRNGDSGRASGGEMIDTGRNGGKGDRGKAVILAEPDGAGVTGGEQIVFTLVAAVPDRSHRMDHMLGRQTISLGDLGLAGGAATKRAAFGKQCGTSGAVNRAIDAATAQQRRIRGVDDGVNAECRDVGNDDFQPRRADLARSQNSGNRVDRDPLVGDRKSTRLNSSHAGLSRMPSSA